MFCIARQRDTLRIRREQSLGVCASLDPRQLRKVISTIQPLSPLCLRQGSITIVGETTKWNPFSRKLLLKWQHLILQILQSICRIAGGIDGICFSSDEPEILPLRIRCVIVRNISRDTTPEIHEARFAHVGSIEGM